MSVWAREPRLVDQCGSLVMTIDYTRNERNSPEGVEVGCVTRIEGGHLCQADCDFICNFFSRKSCL